MATFLNDLYQDKKSTIIEDYKYIKDGIGAFKTTYTAPIKKIKLILSPLTEVEKDSVLTHYAANYAESVDLIVNAYNTGIIPVFYTKAPTISIIGAVHYKVTCEFRG